MKTLLYLLLLIPHSLPLFAQQPINDSLLATFGNKVLENSFREDGINCGLSKTKEFLIKTDLDTARLIKQIGWDRITFYKDEGSLRGLLLKPLEKNKGRMIYWIRQVAYNMDSVDFTIIHATLDNVTNKDIMYSPWCCDGGDMSPPPDGRFVYNKETKAWKYYTAQDIRDQWARNKNNDENCGGTQKNNIK